jgi:radical SAM protein with 4Fe4S-binding SPASM domain
MIKLHEKLGFKPRQAVWELTLRCNLRCRHCGSRAGQQRDDELTLEEMLHVADQLAELECRFLTLSGGEPLMRQEWPLVAERLVAHGITVGMISNGILFDEDAARTAKRVGLETVAFSLDGFQEAHEYQRRVPGQWRMVLNAIEHCKAQGLPPGIVTTINNRNLPELPALREFLRERGVERWQVQFATPTGNMADNQGLMVAPEDFLTAVPLIAEMCSDDLLPVVYPSHNVGYFGEPEERLRRQQAKLPVWTGCSAGCNVIGIESNGNVKGCLSLPSACNGVDEFVEGNLREKSLREIWEGKNAFAYNRQFTVERLGGFCRECPYGEICRGGCTWTTWAGHGAVRDNPYCYYRQTQEQETRRRLPLVE